MGPITTSRIKKLSALKQGRLVTALAVATLLTIAGVSVYRQQASDITVVPTPTPTILVTPSPTTTPSPTPSATPSPTTTPTPTPTSSPTSTPVLTPTPTKPTTTPLIVPTEIVWGDRSYKQVIFTFDAGSGNTSINQILAALQKHNVEGVFFLTGTWAEKYPNDVKKIAAANHAIYNHTYSHPHLIGLYYQQIVDELQRTDAIITSLAGYNSKPYFRAPYGERDARILQIAASQGYRSVYWTIDAWDWKEGITAQQVTSRIMNNLQPGTIYLMHVGDPITGQILDSIFTQIKQRGYALNSLTTGL